LTNQVSREGLAAHALTKIWAFSPRSKYRHSGKYTVERRYSLHRK
jgi:hypothetical protein